MNWPAIGVCIVLYVYIGVTAWLTRKRSALMREMMDHSAHVMRRATAAQQLLGKALITMEANGDDRDLCHRIREFLGSKQ